MGVTGQSITLANSIIGVGILAMPFCFQQCGIVLATLILLLMGLISRLSSYFLLKAALISRRRNFEFLAFHVFGPAGKLAVEVGIIGFLMGTCIAYFVVVGDLGPQIVAKMFNINQSDVLRTSIMVIVSLVCVLPLGLLRNVDSLSNVSAATIGFYFCLVIKVIVEAASQMLNSEWQSKVAMWKPSGVLQCVPIFSMALFCQTQLFEIFESMPTLSLEKMNVVTKNAINICTSVYLTLGVFGYIAFSAQTISGNILISLSPTMASDVIKLGFVMSLAFSFPLIIFPCRASLYSLMYRKVHPSHHDNIINHSIPEGTFRLITVCIVGVTLFISLLIPNIELVLGLVGSTIGVLICMVFPAACFVNITFKNTNERVLAKVILALGLFIMVLGTYANLQAAETKLDRYDDKYITQERIDKIVEEFFESRKLENSEDVIVKPASKEIDQLIQEDKNGKSKETLKSEVQPPNPVPPETQSREKLVQPVVNSGIEDIKVKQSENGKVEDKKIERFETHPKNLNNKLVDVDVQSNGKTIEQHKPKDPLQVAKDPSEQEKLDRKQQRLMETIKQHGEEQKELIKEQKEILDEIKKTKDEFQKDKNEKIVSNEAKKIIAVESIQKIANMAIQSLSVVSDKPNNDIIVNKPKENLEAIANEAVQEIAKKAVETIEAIKISEKKVQEDVLSLNVNNPALKLDQDLQVKSKIDKLEVKKQHLHTADEPQSYKQGEDMQIINNVQLPNILQSNNNLPNKENNSPQQDNVQNMGLNNIQNIQQNALNNLQNNANVMPNKEINIPQHNNVPNIQQNAPNNANVLPNKESNIPQQNIVPNIQQNAPNMLQNNANVMPNKEINVPQQNNIPNIQQNAPNILQNNANVLPNKENNIPQLNNLPNTQQNVPNVQPNNAAAIILPKRESDIQQENAIPNMQQNILSQNNNNIPQQNNAAIHNILPNKESNNPQQNNIPNAQQNNNINKIPQNNVANNNGGASNSNLQQQPIAEQNIEMPYNARPKREVVDCTQQDLLKPEDKQICDTLVKNDNLNKIDVSPNIVLPAVDLEKDISRRLPIDIHYGRSLKSVHEEEKTS